ncbi:MAG: hypothetical protein ACLSAF_07715 [Intestinimonas sp.]
MSVLNPAMTVLESFAGLAAQHLGALALLLTHRWCGQWRLLARGIDWMAAKMNTPDAHRSGSDGVAAAIFTRATIAGRDGLTNPAAGTVLRTEW